MSTACMHDKLIYTYFHHIHSTWATITLEDVRLGDYFPLILDIPITSIVLMSRIVAIECACMELNDGFKLVICMKSTYFQCFFSLFITDCFSPKGSIKTICCFSTSITYIQKDIWVYNWKLIQFDCDTGNSREASSVYHLCYMVQLFFCTVPDPTKYVKMW